MSRKNPRFRLCRVQTILPSQFVNTITGNDSLNARNTREFLYEHIVDKSIDVIKNSDDNTSLIQKQIDSLRNYLEKSLILNFVVLICIMLILVLS